MIPLLSFASLKHFGDKAKCCWKVEVMDGSALFLLVIVSFLVEPLDLLKVAVTSIAVVPLLQGAKMRDALSYCVLYWITAWRTATDTKRRCMAADITNGYGDAVKDMSTRAILQMVADDYHEETYKKQEADCDGHKDTVA